MRHTKIIATRRTRQRFGRDARRADRRRHRHRPAQFLARHARVARGHVRARARGGGARGTGGRHPPGSRRSQDPDRRARGRAPAVAQAGRRAAHRDRRLRRRTGPHLDDVRGPRARRPARRSPAAGRRRRSSCASRRPTASRFETTVVEGGELGEHKGINAPGVALPASAITPKDVDDLKFGLSLGVDMVALSFVQTRGRSAAGASADGGGRRRGRAARRQARTAAGARAPRRHPRVVRRGDGGARRPRPRDAARARAARAEGDHARGAAAAAFR